MSKRKWTEEKIFESAAKEKHIFDWQKNESGAYWAAKKLGIFEKVTSHMTRKIRKNFYKKYTDNDVAVDALKYNTPKEWEENSTSIYNIASQRGLLKKVSSHMIRQIVPKGYWTKENIAEIFIKFKSKSEWHKNHPSSYHAAIKLGLMNSEEIIRHFTKEKMIIYPKKKGEIFDPFFKKKITIQTIKKKVAKWSNEKIFFEAKKFKTIKEWRERSGSSYNFALRNGLVDEASKHMQRLGSLYKRCVYCIKVKTQNLIYIGLTFNFKKRINEHMKTERFINLINLYGRKSIFSEKLTEYVNINEAVELEKKLINDMKQIGWTVLNKAAGGGLGGDQTKWTKKTILENVLNYSTYKDWVKNESGAYAAALDMDLIEEIDKILPRTKGKFKYWTKEKVRDEAKRWVHKNDFRKNSVGAYEAAKKFGIFEDVTFHMIRKKK